MAAVPRLLGHGVFLDALADSVGLLQWATASFGASCIMFVSWDLRLELSRPGCVCATSSDTGADLLRDACFLHG